MSDNALELTVVETVISNTIDKHIFIPAGASDEHPHCSCGQWCDSGPGRKRVYLNFGEHRSLAILAVLKDSGYRLLRPVTPEGEVLNVF